MQNRPNPVQLGAKNLLKASSRAPARAPANGLEGSVQPFKRPQTTTVWGRFFWGTANNGPFFLFNRYISPKTTKLFTFLTVQLSMLA